MHLVMLQWLRCYIVVVLKIIVIQSDHQIISSTWQSSFTQSPLGRVNSSRVSKLQLPKSPRVWLMNSQGRKTLSDGQHMISILLTITFTFTITTFTITITITIIVITGETLRPCSVCSLAPPRPHRTVVWIKVIYHYHDSDYDGDDCDDIVTSFE